MTGTLAPRVDDLPTTRHPDRPFDPPPGLAEIREQNPLVRMTYLDGHDGWLATGHHAVRTILGDRRFSSRYELVHLPIPMEGASPELPRPRSATSPGSTRRSTRGCGACSSGTSRCAGCGRSPRGWRRSPQRGWTRWSATARRSTS